MSKEVGGMVGSRRVRRLGLEMVSREVGVELYRLEAWQARALAGL